MVEIAEKASMIQQIRSQPRRNQLLILIFAILIAYVITTLIIALSGIPDYYPACDGTDRSHDPHGIGGMDQQCGDS